jgi:hypothetical protein
VRARFRERASSPCGEDGDVEPACHPPGGGVCAALFLSSRCMGSVGPPFSFLVFPVVRAPSSRRAHRIEDLLVPPKS